ncbi:hypothetical protein Tco_0667156 [Tanacetum coccineum]
MTESPLMDSGFVVLVFSPRDDPIACLNKAMAFLTAVASSRRDNVKVILVLVITMVLLVLGETIQVDRQRSRSSRRSSCSDNHSKQCCFSPWKGVVRFGKQGKLNSRYVRPFKVLEKVGSVAYKLELPQELSRVHNTFHEPVEIMDREVKRLKQSRIPIFKVRWNSRRGLEFTWERKDQFWKKYPHLFTKTAPSSSAAS